MDKNPSGSATAPPPPSAPPSYEEAVGYVPGHTIPMNPTISSAPYPTGHSSMPMPSLLAHEVAEQRPKPMAMPMPMLPAREMANQMPMPMPMPAPGSHMPGSKLPTMSMPANSAQSYDVGQSSTSARPTTEVRVIHQHVNYHLGPNPVKMNCPTCHADIKTTIISDHQASAHLFCIVLCLLGCCLCSCLPYCMSAFMSVHHFCPNCKSYIDTWKG